MLSFIFCECISGVWKWICKGCFGFYCLFISVLSFTITVLKLSFYNQCYIIILCTIVCINPLDMFQCLLLTAENIMKLALLKTEIRTADLHCHIIYSVLINYNCLYRKLHYICIMFLDFVPSLTCLKMCNVN
jgi:hypothetical protein